jgi:hypothetical protein
MLSPQGGSNFYPYSAINFNSGIADTFSVLRNMGFFITNTSFSDTSGSLLFYTNGVRINNANHDTLLNSDNFNPGYASTINVNQLNIVQGSVIVPKPGSNNLFYIFHVSGYNFNAYGSLQQQPLDMRYTIVDMNLDNGLGGVPANQKSIPIINDTLVNGAIAVCKHGNGRDWWIIMPRFYSNKYYKLLLTQDSLIGPSNQIIGDSIKYDVEISSAFSPDGSTFAQVTLSNSLNIFRFDRCTGNFYDSTFIQVPNPTPGYIINEAFGLSFSPNSRFLYIILFSKIIQYDTWASNIAASETYVAEWDTFANPFYTYFFSAQLAPDNKIYIGTYGGCFNLHYINSPDSSGVNCQVIQNTFALPIENITVPYYPNYDLGRLVGSPCDTLTAIQQNNYTRIKFKVFPNPATDFFWINYNLQSNETAQIILYNILGEEVSKNNLYGTFKSLLIYTSDIPSGIYFYRIKLKNEILAQDKIIIRK